MDGWMSSSRTRETGIIIACGKSTALATVAGRRKALRNASPEEEGTSDVQRNPRIYTSAKQELTSPLPPPPPNRGKGILGGSSKR